MGNTFTTTSASGGGANDGLSRYFATLDAAVALAAILPPLPAWAAATSQRQWAALALATSDVDGSIRYQGRKYDMAAQVLEFPRVAYGSHPGVGINCQAAQDGLRGGDIVWDWDAVNQVAIVPQTVLIATLYQADSLLSGKRAKLIDQLYDGLTSQSVGGASESYDLAATHRSSGLTMALCRRAGELLDKYRIRQGKFV